MSRGSISSFKVIGEFQRKKDLKKRVSAVDFSMLMYSAHSRKRPTHSRRVLGAMFIALLLVTPGICAQIKETSTTGSSTSITNRKKPSESIVDNIAIAADSRVTPVGRVVTQLEAFPEEYSFQGYYPGQKIALLFNDIKMGQNMAATLCEPWSKLFSLLSHQEFVDFVSSINQIDRKRLSSKHLGFLTFMLGHGLGASTSLIPYLRPEIQALISKSSDLLKIRLRNGRAIQAASPQSLADGLGDEFFRHHKTIFLGNLEAFLSYIKDKPQGLYKLSVERAEDIGHTMILEMSEDGKGHLFDPQGGIFPLEELHGPLSIELIGLTKETAAMPLTITGKPILRNWFSAVLGKEKTVLRELFAIDPTHLAYVPGSTQKTPLMVAILTGDLSMVRFLYEELGAKLEGVDEKGRTLVKMANDNKHTAISEYLTKRLAAGNLYVSENVTPKIAGKR